jgi:hypothetical protein
MDAAFGNHTTDTYKVQGVCVRTTDACTVCVCVSVSVSLSSWSLVSATFWRLLPLLSWMLVIDRLIAPCCVCFVETKPPYEALCLFRTRYLPTEAKFTPPKYIPLKAWDSVFKGSPFSIRATCVSEILFDLVHLNPEPVFQKFDFTFFGFIINGNTSLSSDS